MDLFHAALNRTLDAAESRMRVRHDPDDFDREEAATEARLARQAHAQRRQRNREEPPDNEVDAS